MPAKTSALLVDEVVPFRQEVSNEGALSQANAFGGSLPRPGNEPAGENDSPSGLCIPQVLHKPQIVEMRLDSAPHVAGLAYIEGLELVSPLPTEYVNSGGRRQM